MFPEFDKNAAFIWACYAIVFSGIAVACLAVWLRARLAKAKLKRLEQSAADDERQV